MRGTRVRKWFGIVTVSALACWVLAGGQARSEGTGDPVPSVHEIRQLLDAIDPYLPGKPIKVEVDVFGSTTMDALAHGWAGNFKNFYPDAEVVVSAEGSETVFQRLAKSPSSVGMLSRHVTADELRKSGLKQPVAVMVSHEALGVFVHKDNPLRSISFAQLGKVFCPDGTTQELTWKAIGVTGPLADKPIHLIGRNKSSGSQKFVEQYLFRSRPLRAATETYSSNSKVVQAIAADPLAIAICGLKCGSHKARALHLREHDKELPDDDHAILIGDYPLTRPLTLVIDLGANDEKARASREFVRYALSQAGQMQTILAGFFPLDPATLRSELLKLNEPLTPSAQRVNTAERVPTQNRRGTAK